MPEEVATEVDVPSFAEVASQVNEAASRGEAIPAPQVEAKPTKPAPEAKPQTPPTPPAEAPKPEAKESKDSPLSKLMGKKEKPVEKPAEKPEDKPIDWKTAPKEFRERYEKLSNEHKTIAQKAQEAEQKLQQREQELEKLKADSTGSKVDLKLIEEKEKQIAKYEETIRELDYSRSDEYTKLHKDYSDKYTQRYIQAAEDLKQFTVVTGKNELGEPVTRTATDADLAALVQKPIAEQRRLAREMFGQDADVAIRHLERLKEIADEGRHTLQTKLQEARTNGEVRAKEQRLQQERQAQEYHQHLDNFRKEIVAENPDIFTPPKDDPEALEAFERGMDFAAKATDPKHVANLTPQERAAHQAVLQYKAAAYDIQEHTIGKLKTQVGELMKELEGFRGSDPGNGGAKPAPAVKVEGDDDLDFKKAAAVFDNMV